MVSIKNAAVHAALDRAAANIKSAAGDDGIASRADMRQALGGLAETERALTDLFFRFIDHRDDAPGARVTKVDVDRAVEYAKNKLIDRYDLNGDGLSGDEIAEMSRIGMLAVKLSQELGGTTTPEVELPSRVRGAIHSFLYERLEVVGDASLTPARGDLETGFQVGFEADDRSGELFATKYQGEWVFSPVPVTAAELDTAVKAAGDYWMSELGQQEIDDGELTEQDAARLRAGFRPVCMLFPGETDRGDLCAHFPHVFYLEPPEELEYLVFHAGVNPETGEAEGFCDN